MVFVEKGTNNISHQNSAAIDKYDHLLMRKLTDHQSVPPYLARFSAPAVERVVGLLLDLSAPVKSDVFTSCNPTR